jgi:hypothetical protein
MRATAAEGESGEESLRRLLLLLHSLRSDNGRDVFWRLHDLLHVFHTRGLLLWEPPPRNLPIPAPPLLPIAEEILLRLRGNATTTTEQSPPTNIGSCGGERFEEDSAQRGLEQLLQQSLALGAASPPQEKEKRTQHCSPPPPPSDVSSEVDLAEESGDLLSGEHQPPPLQSTLLPVSLRELQLSPAAEEIQDLPSESPEPTTTRHSPSPAAFPSGGGDEDGAVDFGELELVVSDSNSNCEEMVGLFHRSTCAARCNTGCFR